MKYKFRQPLTDVNGNFKEWFYWGFIDDTFITPANQLNGYDTRNKSEMWTGLLDKHDVEIYTGDILKSPSKEATLTVKYNVGSFIAQYMQSYVLPSNFYLHEVIGNIYENPELLNAK